MLTSWTYVSGGESGSDSDSIDRESWHRGAQWSMRDKIGSSVWNYKPVLSHLKAGSIAIIAYDTKGKGWHKSVGLQGHKQWGVNHGNSDNVGAFAFLVCERNT